MVRALLAACAVAAATAAPMASPAIAQENVTTVATYRDWSVFVREANGEKICFAATEAKDKSPKSVNHGEIFFLIATWKSGAAVEQPNLMTGYQLNARPEPTVRIGSDKWTLYSSENEAFIEAAEEEKRLIRAMRRGLDMRVNAVSQRGTATSYVMSLRGVSNALDRAKSECRG
ncbi:MAG: invasion associated locus B family protein [Pseudomonadota bacterium]